LIGDCGLRVDGGNISRASVVDGVNDQLAQAAAAQM
jgi:hypothetical protein